ncbi:MAG: hypothetical protein QM731_16345 [Chitinophagaceae bacterium]
MFKRALLLGLVSGLLAGIAAVVYQRVYAGSLGYDFAGIATLVNIIAASLFGGVLAAIGYWLIVGLWLKEKGEIVFNLLIVAFSFVSILAPFAYKLPLEAEMPELFPGLTVPMHFFPALAWFTLKPLFIKTAR